MKKLALAAALVMLLQTAFAGGLLTNYNQSAQYVRMLSRNASLNIDGVFYNPAGLTSLQDGWHFAFYSQTIFQKRKINSDFSYLNNSYYEGETTIPVFPDLYGVYKKDKWAFSLGVGPVGGGGTANFDNGLPSFEIPVSKIVPSLAALSDVSPALAVNSYDMNMKLEASSIFWGIQLGATYEINKVFSVYGGVRVMPSVNTYKGSITGIMVNNTPAAAWLTGAATQVGTFASAMQAAADMPETLSPFLDAGGSYTLAQLEGANMLNAQQKAQIEAGLVYAGVSPEMISVMNLNQIHAAYVQASPTFQANADQLNATAGVLTQTSGSMNDKEVDVKQKGMGFTPIIGVNINPNEDWNIALKYEHKTYMKLENETTIDEMGLFPDGAKTQNDVPAIFTAGVGYRGLKWLEAQLSYNLYFDKKVSYGNNVRYQTTGMSVPREIDNNYYELALGLQFNLSDKFAISVGGLKSEMGVGDSYQSDFSFSNSSHTLAGGISWKLTDRITLDAGMLNTFYKKETVTFEDPTFGNYNESYQKTTMSFSAGISYSIF
ncbi:MAG: OmpP1/FadL family transporter [Draconibacterium sp.]